MYNDIQDFLAHVVIFHTTYNSKALYKNKYGRFALILAFSFTPKYKKIHTYTRAEGASSTKIDFLIVDERLKRKVVDSRAYFGAGIETDQLRCYVSLRRRQEVVNIINEALKKKGMTVNVSKTNTMVLEKEESMTEIMIEEERIKQAKEIVQRHNLFQGSMFTSDGKC